MAGIYLPQVKGLDVDGHSTWRTTLDYGYFTSREQIEAWVDQRDDPAEWDWEECSPSSFPSAEAAPAEMGSPRDGLQRIVSAHIYDGGHGALDARQVEGIVEEIADAVEGAYYLTARSAAAGG